MTHNCQRCGAEINDIRFYAGEGQDKAGHLLCGHCTKLYNDISLEHFTYVKTEKGYKVADRPIASSYALKDFLIAHPEIDTHKMRRNSRIYKEMARSIGWI